MIKPNDDSAKSARSLGYKGKYIRNTNWNSTQPCVYDGDDFPDKHSKGQKTVDDLLAWAGRKEENRSS